MRRSVISIALALAAALSASGCQVIELDPVWFQGEIIGWRDWVDVTYEGPDLGGLEVTVHNCDDLEHVAIWDQWSARMTKFCGEFPATQVISNIAPGDTRTITVSTGGDIDAMPVISVRVVGGSGETLAELL